MFFECQNGQSHCRDCYHLTRIESDLCFTNSQMSILSGGHKFKSETWKLQQKSRTSPDCHSVEQALWSLQMLQMLWRGDQSSDCSGCELVCACPGCSGCPWQGLEWATSDGETRGQQSISLMWRGPRGGDRRHSQPVSGQMSAPVMSLSLQVYNQSDPGSLLFGTQISNVYRLCFT